MKGTRESRRHPRAPLLSIVECALPNGRTLTAPSGNISCGGLFLSTNQEAPKGERVRVKLRLPFPGHHLEHEARVVWSRPLAASPESPAGIGLEFEDLPAQDIRAISQYVQHAANVVA